MFRIPMRRSLESWRNYRSRGSALDGYNSCCKISHELWMKDNGVRFQEARKHNKEMHCQNGNIDFCAERGESSVMVVQRCRKEAWEMPVIEAMEYKDTASHQLLENQEELFQQKTYRDAHSNYISNYPSHSGTLHYPTKLLGSSMMMDSDVVRVLAEETTPECPLLCGCEVPKEMVEEACRKEGKEIVPYDKIPVTERNVAEGKIRRTLDEKAEKCAADFIAEYPSLETSLKASTSISGPVSSKLCTCRLIQYYSQRMASGLSAEGELVGEGLPSDILKFAFKQDLLGVKTDLKWVGVGVDTIKSSRLVMTYEYQQLLTDHTPHTCMRIPCHELLFANYAHVKEAGLKAFEKEYAGDWRSLGIRVALYDDLRELRSTPPTGVEWAINAKTVWQREIIFSNHFSDPWGYEAIATDLSGLEQCARNNWNIFFNPPQNGGNPACWNINNNDNIAVIFLHNSASTQFYELETWVLSHLTYPLAGIAETFKIYDIRDMADGTSRSRFTEGQGRTQVFFRNSSLIDLPISARKIVFVVMNNSSSQVTLGGVTLKIKSFNDKYFPAPYAFDEALRVMVRKVLESPCSLKTEFSTQNNHLFVSRIDWREIEQLVAYLTTRWHPQPEGLSERSGNDRESRRTFSIHHCPKGTSRYYCEDAPEKNPLTDLWDYGQGAAALGFDHALGPQALVRRQPALSLGPWTTHMEIALGYSIAKYNSENEENVDDINLRDTTGGWDRLLRATYMRIGFEEWKKQAGIRDQILAPWAYKDISTWMQLISLKPAYCNVDAIDTMLCTNTVKWNWSLNRTIDIPATLTGMRTSVDMKKSYLSCKLSHESLSNLTEGRYNLMNTRIWSFDKYTSCEKSGRELELDRLLMRINVNDWHNQISYNYWSVQREMARLAVRSENRMSHVLHIRAGWKLSPTIEKKNVLNGYSWGVPSFLNLWEDKTCVSVVLDKMIVGMITSDVFYAGTWLASTPSVFRQRKSLSFIHQWYEDCRPFSVEFKKKILEWKKSKRDYSVKEDDEK